MRVSVGDSQWGHGPFLGCSHYPDCQYIRPLKAQADGHVVKTLEGQPCPECGSDMMLRQGRFGMFIGCSQYPQCDHTEVIDKPDETSIDCPQCGQGKLLQRKSRFGKVFMPVIATPTVNLRSTNRQLQESVVIATTHC